MITQAAYSPAKNSDKVKFECINCLPNGRVNGFRKINAFIGPNNSGKSWLLRNLFSAKQFKVTDLTIGNSGFINALENLSEFCIQERKPVFDDFINKGINGYSIFFNNYNESNRETDPIKHLVPNDEKQFNEIDKGKDFISKWRELESSHLNDQTLTNGSNYTRIYFPSVRSTKRPADSVDQFPIYNQTQDLYFKSETNSLNTEGELHRLDSNGSKVAIFTGESLYLEVRKSLLGLSDKRQIISDFEIFIGDTFFNKEKVTIIPNEERKCLFVSIGNQPERPIHELGDGISQIMILIYPIFALKGKKLILFIEEPELYLHPGLQRKLIESFLTLPHYVIQVFLTTHSNHLLDVFYNHQDVAIYTTRKDMQVEGSLVKFTVTPHSPEESENFLDLLEVSPSSMFMTNCHILVEGATDKKIYQKLLSLHLRNIREEDRYLEDVNYNFISVGGDNLSACLKDGQLKIDKTYFYPLVILDGDKKEDYIDTHKRIEFLMDGETLSSTPFLRQCFQKRYGKIVKN